MMVIMIDFSLRWDYHNIKPKKLKKGSIGTASICLYGIVGIRWLFRTNGREK